ncbi:MAG TPA: nucleoside diphosphate kinase regulator [Fredinandcohnia sp.]|nr:nucleoside diphosphate kinase regulator [Fredinandcohnia sp.]
MADVRPGFLDLAETLGEHPIMGSDRRITISTKDMERIQSLLDSTVSVRNREALENLEAELDAAIVVKPEEIPRNVVTMGSRVRFRDEETNQTHEVTLVYPRDADPQSNKISILAPIGAALIGLKVGERIDWPLPNGRRRRLVLEEILYQPEADGATSS